MQTPTELVPAQPSPEPSSEQPLTRRQLLRRGAVGALTGLVLAGCAKAPSSGSTSPVSGPQLFVTMTVRGTINPTYYYYVLFNVNNAPGPGGTGATGPVPVVAPPYGNGFAAGAFTTYVQYHGTNGGTGFGYYAISPDLLTPIYIGSSGPLVTSQAVGNTLSFQLPLAQLVPPNSALTVDQITQIEINFVSTNIVPAIGDNPTDKYFDSLGPPESSGTFVNLIVRPTGVGGGVQQILRQNSDTGIESQEQDVAQAGNGSPQRVSGTINGVTINDLDIIDWSLRLNP